VHGVNVTIHEKDPTFVSMEEQIATKEDQKSKYIITRAAPTKPTHFKDFLDYGLG
jgi:hypothetical protein